MLEVGDRLWELDLRELDLRELDLRELNLRELNRYSFPATDLPLIAPG